VFNTGTSEASTYKRCIFAAHILRFHFQIQFSFTKRDRLFKTLNIGNFLKCPTPQNEPNLTSHTDGVSGAGSAQQRTFEAIQVGETGRRPYVSSEGKKSGAGDNAEMRPPHENKAFCLVIIIKGNASHVRQAITCLQMRGKKKLGKVCRGQAVLPSF
jgi:hypothetical protein